MRAALLCLATAGLCASIPFMEHPGLYAIAAGLLLCFLVPAWNDWRRNQLDIFEPIHVLGLIYFIYFGLGSLWLVAEPELAYDYQLVAHVPRAALYVLLGYLSLLAGYYGPWRGRRLLSRDESPRGSLLFLLLPGVLGLAGSLASMVHHDRMLFGQTLSVFMSSLSQLAPLFLFAWALLWLLLLAKRSTFRQRLTWLILAPGAALVLYKTFSNKTTIMSLLVIPVLAMWYARRRVPWKTLLLLLLLLIFIVFPLYNTYRVTDIHLEHSKRLELTYRMVQDWDTEQYMTRSWGTFKARMAMINSVAVVVRDTPRWVPFAKGETIFMPTLTYFVPRVLWPDKPIQRTGREFADKFRVTGGLDASTTIASTVVGEMYWNFGLPGVLLGMALMGAMMRWIYRRYGESQALDPLRRALYLLLLLSLLHFDAAVASALVNLVRIILAVEALRWVGRTYGQFRASPASEAPGLLAPEGVRS